MNDAILTPDYLFNADPTLHVIAGRLWLFATHDQTSVRFIKGDFSNMYDYQAMSTNDFRTWVHHGSIFSIHDVAWAKGNAVWDGDAGIEANGRFYAYAPFDFQIGVLVSDHPAGPYRDALGHPLIHRDETNQGFMAVSPSVIFDGQTPYLVYGWGKLYIAKLKPNMIELAEAPRQVSVPGDFVESPIIARINGRYYLTYSNGGLWGEREYDIPRIRYSISDSISGPYVDSRTLQEAQVNSPESGFRHQYASSAHQGFACYKGQWYFAYHRDSADGCHRHVCVTKLDVHEDGTLAVVDPNTDPGVTGKPAVLLLDAFAPYKREAEEFHDRSGAAEEQGIRQDYHFKMRDGGFLRFNNMDFGTGADGYRIEVSCENRNLTGGTVEFRLDAADGPLLAACPVEFTGGTTDYVIKSGEILTRIGGIHDLYIVAHGNGGDTDASLFNINWFTFT